MTRQTMRGLLSRPQLAGQTMPVRPATLEPPAHLGGLLAGGLAPMVAYGAVRWLVPPPAGVTAAAGTAAVLFGAEMVVMDVHSVLSWARRWRCGRAQLVAGRGFEPKGTR